MPHTLRYVVTDMRLRFWRGRLGEVPHCRLCDEEFVVGDEVITKNTNKSAWSKRRYYHARCFDEGTVPIQRFLY